MAEQTTNIDWNNLSPINPEIMQYQATINIGRLSAFLPSDPQVPLDTSPTESPPL